MFCVFGVVFRGFRFVVGRFVVFVRDFMVWIYDFVFVSGEFVIKYVFCWFWFGFGEVIYGCECFECCWMLFGVVRVEFVEDGGEFGIVLYW